jgi:IS5 family transposase
MRPSKRRALPKDDSGMLMEQYEQAKASTRAKVEHAFHVIKNLLGPRKTRYRGPAKNTSQLYTLFGLANPVRAKRWLFTPDTEVRAEKSTR